VLKRYFEGGCLLLLLKDGPDWWKKPLVIKETRLYFSVWAVFIGDAKLHSKESSRLGRTVFGVRVF